MIRWLQYQSEDIRAFVTGGGQLWYLACSSMVKNKLGSADISLAPSGVTDRM